MVSSLFAWNMNMAEWERDAARQGQSESANGDEDESNDEDEQWRAGYLAAPQQLYSDHPHYAYGPYNTAVAPAYAISPSDGAVPFPRYQAYASFPYLEMGSDAKLEGIEAKSTSSDHDDKKPAALPIDAMIDHVERNRSVEESDDETEWTDGFEPIPTGGQAMPSYAPPSRHVGMHHSMPREHAAHPDRHLALARYEQRSRQGHAVQGSRLGQPVIAARVPSAEELRESQTPRAKQALNSWYDRFNELIEYMAVHGDCNVPQKYEENPKLGVWVNKQRMEKKFLDDGKRSSMTEIKQRNLESIGFKWAKRKGNVSWEIKYRELKEYSQRHGNCNVPTKYSQNPALGRWVSTQRSEFKKFQQGRSKHMSREKVEKLTAIGFKWEMLQQRSESDDSSDREADREADEG